MKKSEVKTGMRVKHRNGEIGIILKDIDTIVYKDGYNNFSDEHYSEDLESIEDFDDAAWDIVEVFRGFTQHSEVFNHNVVGETIWRECAQETTHPQVTDLSLLISKIEDLTKELSEIKSKIQ